MHRINPKYSVCKKDTIINPKCIICDVEIEFASVLRKFCRCSDCRTIFYRLKRCWINKNLSNLTDKEKIIYHRLVKDGEFEKRTRAKKDESPLNLSCTI